MSIDDFGAEPPPDDLLGALAPPRPHRRLRSVSIDKEKIAQRVVDFYKDDLMARQPDRQRRIQRYAKFRMWTEGKSWPWVGASDIGLPDMMEKSLRVQDTLHNAVMASRPTVMNARATVDADKEKEGTIDELLDFQVFVECKGENKIGDLIESFVNDGCFTCFSPWVKEKRDVTERIEFPAPDEMQDDFFYYLQTLVQQMFPGVPNLRPSDGEGWEWNVQVAEGEMQRVCFYTEDDDTDEGDGKILAIVKKYVTTHDGPVIIPCDYDDVIYPPGVANLQAPCAANPGGAPHVILRSSPTIDEIRQLAATGYYDLATPEDLEKLQPVSKPSNNEMKKEALDKIQGQAEIVTPKDKSQGTLTRLICFDRFDIDGDGLAEDVVFWVLEEPKIVLRARHLSEVFPAKVPRRPLAEATFVPAGGRREGISLLEIQEGLHDIQKMLFDITSDSGVLSALPFFFYRMAGAMKPENLAIFPGMGVPMGDPQRDVFFPQIGNQAGLGMLLNLISIVGQWGDRATMIGDFQLGRVPAGRSSALRTTGSVSMLQAQGDARPERILRRFFIGLSQVYQNLHDLNCAFMPRDKQIRVSGVKRPDQDPFRTISGREAIDGIFEFEFAANAFNTSKAMMQQALQQMAAMYVSPIAIQAGLTTPDKMFNLFTDLGKAFGLNPDRYLQAPSPEASLPLITAEDAITAIVSNQAPFGRPAEPGGTMEHLQKLAQFVQSDELGQLQPPQIKVLGDYIKSLVERVLAEQQQAALAQAAAQFQQGGQAGPGQDPGGAPAQSVADPNAPPPQVSGAGELMDETLPTAGPGGGMQLEAAE